MSTSRYQEIRKLFHQARSIAPAESGAKEMANDDTQCSAGVVPPGCWSVHLLNAAVPVERDTWGSIEMQYRD